MAIAAVASAAYQAAAKMSSGAASSGASSGAGFGDFLTSAMKDAIGTMKGGEQAAAQQAAGKGDMVSVVNAVNQAELTLDTVVAVRDKVITAYQSIMQMPI
ncbi:MAG: flagellar hook-basal body complex protein FliE [Proteobacteria bacterium]|nr:flagellar hook-basal body complex protein FliE [Pseudomonadota bacterium]